MDSQNQIVEVFFLNAENYVTIIHSDTFQNDSISWNMKTLQKAEGGAEMFRMVWRF